MSEKIRAADDMFRASQARGLRNIARYDLDLTAGLVDVIIRSPGTLLYLDRVTTGYAAVELNAGQSGALDPLTLVSGDSVECPFETLKLNAPAQSGKTLRLLICNGVSVRGGNGIAAAGGSVSNNVALANAALTNAQRTVTNASATMIAANAARRYLLIQNNDATGNIFVRLDGGIATAATGIKIPPGGYYENFAPAPTGAIVAIGDIASNANVVTVEG